MTGLTLPSLLFKKGFPSMAGLKFFRIPQFQPVPCFSPFRLSPRSQRMPSPGSVLEAQVSSLIHCPHQQTCISGAQCGDADHLCRSFCVLLYPGHCTRLQSCCYSVTKFFLTLCSPMDYSKPGFPVFDQFPEFAQTHVHWIGDAIQPYHPLLPPSSALNLS